MTTQITIFSTVPKEINKEIVGFVTPEKMTNKGVQQCGRIFVNFSLVCKEFHEMSKDKLKDLQKIDALITKYPRFNASYENPPTFTRLDINRGTFVPDKEKNSLVPGGNPQLLDALFTGFDKNFRGTFETYSPEIEEDIKEIVKLTPQSLKCALGELRNRKFVTPLIIACFNENIPIHIVELLLEKGANPNTSYEVDYTQTHMLKDVKKLLENPERFAAIEALFKKYGVNLKYTE